MDLNKPPYVDAEGNPTPENPNYHAWKAKRDMLAQTSVNGAPKQQSSVGKGRSQRHL